MKPEYKIIMFPDIIRGAVAWLVEALCYEPKGRGFHLRSAQLVLQLTHSLQPGYLPELDSATNINEYQNSSWEKIVPRRHVGLIAS
jgi:hypothetical protein